ncbi:MAG: hypothetical protein AAF927_24665 [Bacteroidota bacterium]
MSKAKPSIQFFVLSGIILSLHLIFWVYQSIDERYYLLDSQEYVKAADNLRQEGTLFSGDLNAEPLRIDHYTKRPPLYPTLLALCQWGFGHEKYILLLQLFLSLFNLNLVWQIGKLMGWKRKPYWLLGLLLLLYPAQVIYANLIMTEILFQTEICLLVYGSMLAYRSRNLKIFAGLVLLLILAMLTKPIMYLFGLPMLIVWSIWAWQWKKPLILAFGLLPLLFVWGYQEWNESRTGFFHFSSIQNLSLLQYTTYNLLQNTYGPELALHKADSILYASLEITDYGESQRYLQGACFAVINQHKGEYVFFHLKGMFNFFVDPGRFDLYHFFGWETVGGEGLQIAFSRGGYRGVLNYLADQPLARLIFLLLIALANAFKLLCLLVFPFLKKVSLWDRVLIVGMILYIAGLTGVSGASRFAVPLFPLLLVVSMSVFLHGERLYQLRSKRQ